MAWEERFEVYEAEGARGCVEDLAEERSGWIVEEGLGSPSGEAMALPAVSLRVGRSVLFCLLGVEALWSVRLLALSCRGSRKS